MLEKGLAVSGCIHLIPVLSILYCNGNRIGDCTVVVLDSYHYFTSVTYHTQAQFWLLIS